MHVLTALKIRFQTHILLLIKSVKSDKRCIQKLILPSCVWIQGSESASLMQKHTRFCKSRLKRRSISSIAHKPTEKNTTDITTKKICYQNVGIGKFYKSTIPPMTSVWGSKTIQIQCYEKESPHHIKISDVSRTLQLSHCAFLCG